MYSRTGKRKRQTVVLLMVLAALLAAVYYRFGDTVIDQSQRLVLAITSPIQKSVDAAVRPVRRAADYAFEITRTSSDNRRLKAENLSLAREVRQLKKHEAENRRLKRLAGLRSRSEFETVAARVIARSPSSWQSIVTIDVGRAGGVGKRMAVITDKGLVGQVLKESSSAALVQLVNDQRSGVGVEFSRTGATGIVEGSVDGRLKLRFIPDDADVKVGDKLVTSGAGGVYPRGIPVGSVAGVSQTVYSLEKQIELKPAVNYGRLSEVLIVVDLPSMEGP
jgi:rod shape-determining protein MreC